MIRLAFAFILTAFTSLIAAKENTPPEVACGVREWTIVNSTVEKYIDIINGKEVTKARALAILPTVCAVLLDSAEAAQLDTTEAKGEP